jgi:Concanavalin A-like lectin/glucanases superfamily
MINKYKIIKSLMVALVIGLVIAGCEKMTRPVLPANYPQDKPVTPTTSLRFFLPFDSTSPADKQLNIRFADSISNYPSFFPDPSTTAVPGVSGTAYQGSLTTYLHYYSANDFGSSTSFSFSFWLQIPLASKDNVNADGVFALASTSNFWGEITAYADHTTGGNSDSMDLKFHFANGTGDNWDFSNYVGASRWPHMYDGNWHQVAFTYDATSKTGTMYRDGVQFDQKTNETIVFDGNASQFVVGGFQEAASIVDTYSDNTWMSSFPGALDQIRLYNVALAASDIQALYSGKQ